MRIRQFCLLLAATVAAAVVALPAQAALLIEVDKSTQRMVVSQDGAALYTWPVSTGIEAHDTPAGEFTPFRMEKDHFSREWDDAPMPNSIFFTKKGHAIHGSFHKSIGQPASHGCVRLSPKNAETLFALVKQEGMANTKVVLTGEIPAGAPAVAKRAPQRQDNDYARYYSTDDSFDDYVGQPAPAPRRQRVVRGWREYNDGPRYYYYRDVPPPSPPIERRYYRAGSNNPFPFGW